MHPCCGLSTLSIRKDAGRSIAGSCSTPTAVRYLQTDDYQAYYAQKARDGVIGLYCWTHTLRKFEKALDYDRGRASAAMNLIQQLYAV
jgi:hypothetical protein